MTMEEAQVPPGGRKREQRQKVALSVRVKMGMQWADATILNASSRGLMMKTAQAPERGGYIEIRRGADIEIVGRVVWRNGNHVGVRTQDAINVQALMRPPVKGRTQDRSPSKALYVSEERKRTDAAAREERSRQLGSLVQYSAIGGCVVVVAVMLGTYVYDLLSATTNRILAVM